MRIIRSLTFQKGTREEKLPYEADFPYTASRAELNYYRESFVPWHWHKAVELFFMESGELEYHTPGGIWVFPAGSGGMVNANVLHMTKFRTDREANIQLLHIFEPELIAGSHGSAIGKKYVMPVTADSRIEVIPLYPDTPAEAEIIRQIVQAFDLQEKEFGYEIRIREAMSQIWLQLAVRCLPRFSDGMQGEDGREAKTNPSKDMTDKMKTMMVYIHEHFAEKISIPELAAAAFLSERECYRVFRSCLHMTPAEYMREYRLQAACRMLAEGRLPVTEVGYACGLGNSSYFGKVFRESAGCTPSEYRRKWQDRDKR